MILVLGLLCTFAERLHNVNSNTYAPLHKKEDCHAKGKSLCVISHIAAGDHELQINLHFVVGPKSSLKFPNRKKTGAAIRLPEMETGGIPAGEDRETGVNIGG